MGQKINPHGIRIGIIKDWDSKWCPEDELYISDELLRHSFVNRRIILKKLLGKRGYKKVVNKVKTLSR